jgi:hypothetical protein
LAGVDGIDDDDDDASFHLDTSVGSGGLRKGIEASPVDSEESDRPLPPLPTSDKTRSPAEGLLMSPTAQGSINRRRQQHPVASRSVSSISELNNGSPRGSLVDSPDTSSPRNRTVSALKSFGHANGGDVTVPPMPPLQAAYKSTLAPPIRLQGNAHLAPSPESQPQDPLHRPFHLLRLLHASMDPTKPGAYITSFFHIDSTMWKPASWRQSTKGREIRLNAQDAKTRVCAALVAHLEAIKTRGAPLLEGQRTTPYGDDPTASGLSTAEKDQVGRVAADLASLLDGFDDELDTSHKALHSKGVPVGAWKGKSKAGWGSRLSARVDKMSRNSDSTDRYIDLLQQLFASFQTLDDHLSCITGPCTPAYHALPAKTYRHLEARLTRASQFVGIVVVPCVMDDLRQLLVSMAGVDILGLCTNNLQHAYLKGGVRYLEDV